MLSKANENVFLEIIYSSRLILQRFNKQHMDFIISCSNMPEAAGDFMSQEQLTVKMFEQRFVDHFYWNEKAKSYIVSIKEGELIGLIRFWQKATDAYTALIAVQICLPEKRKKGFGTEAQIVLVKRLFDCCHYKQVEMYTDLKNIAQQRCLDKLGFRFIDVETYNDHGLQRNGKLYRLTRHEYGNLTGYIY